MKTVIAAVIATSIALTANPANALSDKQEGALIGIGSLLLFQNIAARNSGPMSYPQDTWGNTSSRGQFPPFRCSGSEVDCAYERGVYERKLQEWEDMKQEAYLCGRYPDRAECSR